MLTMLLLLAQTASGETRPPSPPAPGVPSASMPMYGLSTPLCRDTITRTDDAVTPGGGLMWREGDEPVRMYRLLDRRVNGCPAPIVVMDRVPGSNALGREAVAPGRGGRPIAY
ncbi:hypothetical protein MMB232_00491 [Brevundimonas subvibrioides]|uniref:hypothetical protein n=1 Tax=Brevundimonas subvibrioides TaxID=74313 RepID=UPI0032D58B3C